MGGLVVLSAREESPRLGHLVAVFKFRTNFPDHCDDADTDNAHDGGVGLPVGGLGVPTTGRRPDVLRVPAASVKIKARRSIDRSHLRDLSSSTHCVV
jgi:hypothetical protein